MNKLLVTLTLATAFAASATCAPYIKSTSGEWFPTTGGAGTVSIAPAAAGNLVIVSAFSFSQASPLAVSDSQGNVWNPVVGLTNGVSGSEYQSWYTLVKNTSPISVSVRYTNGSNYTLQVTAEEYSGVTGLDKHVGVSLPASASPVSVGPLSPTANGELLWAISNSGAVTGAGSSYIAAATSDITHSEYQVLGATVGAGGSYSAGFLTNGNGSNTSLMFATFTMAAGGPTPPPVPTPVPTPTPTPAPSGSLIPLSPNPAGVYGSSTQVPQITVNQYGQITGTSNIPVTGGSGSTVYVGTDKDAKGDFGCKGDGSTDDTGCLQNAINATQSAGGSLFLPPGKYKTSSTLTITKAISIGGHQGTVCSDYAPWCGSQIYYTGSGTAVQVNGFVTRINFHDLTISSSGGNGSAAVGVYLNQVEESGFDRVNIGDYGGSGAEKKGFTAAIKTNHFAIGWIRDCNFEDDTYVLDVEGGFYAKINIENNNLYHDLALIRADGGSSNLNILNNWFESVVYLVYVDSSNARLQGGTIQGNHENTDASSGNCSGLPCSSARIIKVTTGGGYLTSFVIAGNSINLGGGPTSFFDLAAPADHFALVGNQLMGSPSAVFSGSASATVGTLANNMPSSLGTATRLTQ